MPDVESSNRREDFRVDDVIPMLDVPMSTEEYEIRRCMSGFDHGRAPCCVI